MKIAFAGGGSLGPVTPLLAVSRAMKGLEPKAEFIWFGTEEGPERALVEAEGIRFFPITVAKLPRYPSIRWITFPFDALKAKREAKSVLIKERPNVVVSVGGFTAVPVIREAAAMNIPCAIHQLDAVLSWSNRAVESLCTSKTSSFKREGYLQIATPTRFDANDLPEHPVQKKTVFVVGGGTGAAALNEAISSKRDEWLRVADVIHATGAGKKGELKNAFGYTVKELFDQEEMKLALGLADIVITRAGIGGLADIAACSKAAVVVPIPNNQQEENARLFKQAGAAIVVEQGEAFSERLLNQTKQLLANPALIKELGERAHAFFTTDNGEELAREVLKILK